jgi:hypothetical protein
MAILPKTCCFNFYPLRISGCVTFLRQIVNYSSFSNIDNLKHSATGLLSKSTSESANFVIYRIVVVVLKFPAYYECQGQRRASWQKSEKSDKNRRRSGAAFLLRDSLALPQAVAAMAGPAHPVPGLGPDLRGIH